MLSSKKEAEITQYQTLKTLQRCVGFWRERTISRRKKRIENTKVRFILLGKYFSIFQEQFIRSMNQRVGDRVADIFYISNLARKALYGIARLHQHFQTLAGEEFADFLEFVKNEWSDIIFSNQQISSHHQNASSLLRLSFLEKKILDPMTKSSILLEKKAIERRNLIFQEMKQEYAVNIIRSSQLKKKGFRLLLQASIKQKAEFTNKVDQFYKTKSKKYQLRVLESLRKFTLLKSLLTEYARFSKVKSYRRDLQLRSNFFAAWRQALDFKRQEKASAVLHKKKAVLAYENSIITRFRLTILFRAWRDYFFQSALLPSQTKRSKVLKLKAIDALRTNLENAKREKHLILKARYFRIFNIRSRLRKCLKLMSQNSKHRNQQKEKVIFFRKLSNQRLKRIALLTFISSYKDSRTNNEIAEEARIFLLMQRQKRILAAWKGLSE